MGAICEICQQDMLKVDGCIPHGYGKTISGIYWVAPMMGNEFSRCHDCGAKNNQLHHPGCDMELCPKCGGQAISCDCNLPKIFIQLEMPSMCGKEE